MPHGTKRRPLVLRVTGALLRRHGRQVSDDELDVALAAGKLELTRPNRRAVRCTRASCGRIVGPHQARQLWVDGVRRGFLCINDCWNLGKAGT